MKRLFFFFSIIFLYSTTFAQQHFIQQTMEAGLERAIRGHGVAAADYNNDGYIDLYFVTKNVNSNNPGGAPNFLFKNLGNGTFVDVAQEAGVEGIIDTANAIPYRVNLNYGASWADFDNDGDVDLFLTNKGVNELHENLGNGTFSDIAQQAGLGQKFRESTSAAWLDYDLDGDLDLYVSNYGRFGPDLSAKNEFYRNNGDGTFTDVTLIAGVAGAYDSVPQIQESDWTYTTLVIDANMDGWPDLYCVNDYGGNIFFLNQKDGTFRKATEEFNLQDPGHGMGATYGDFDNDGLFDIYLTNIEDGEDEWNRLFKHQSDNTFQEVAEPAGTASGDWSWGTEFFDFDLDGWLDLYVVNGQNGEPMANRLFRNLGNGSFEEISAQTGTNSTDEARGMCVADFDNDGRLDIIVPNYDTRADLYMNTTQNGNYLKINLIGTQSNRDAYGAIVKIEAGGQTCYRPNTGVHYLGQSKRSVHFGFGEASIAEKIIVKWPLGMEQEFTNVAINRTIAITEGSSEIKDVITSARQEATVSPQDFQLNTFPNPVKIGAKIQFVLAKPDLVQIEIYDVLGRKVRTVAHMQLSTGTHTIGWSATDDTGLRLSSGVYYLRVATGGLNVSKAVLVVR